MTANRRTGVTLLFVGILLVSSIGPALATPRVFVASASLEESQAVPGEAVNVTFELRNTGESGAGQIQIERNGSAVYTDRYQVESGAAKRVTEQITFEEPGRYNISVNDKSAGVLQVSQTLAETTSVRSDGRSMVLRGGRVTYNSLLTTEFPATNDTITVESLRYRTLSSAFERPVEVYTNTSTAAVDIPSGERTTVYGAVTITSRSGIDDHRVRLGVNQSVVNESSIAREAVHIYRASNDGYVQLNTTQIAVEDGRYLFEAATNDTGTLLLGSLAPAFDVHGHALSTSESESEKRIVVTANVSNTGSVRGTYTATMYLGDEVVDNTTVDLEPAATRAITVSHRLSRDGTYQVRLDETTVGTVVVATGESQTEVATETDDAEAGDDATESPESTTEIESGDDSQTTSDQQPTDQQPTDQQPTNAGDDTNEGTTDSSAGSTQADDTKTDSETGGLGISLSTDDVGLTEIAIGGSVAVIGVILVLLQRW